MLAYQGKRNVDVDSKLDAVRGQMAAMQALIEQARAAAARAWRPTRVAAGKAGGARQGGGGERLLLGDEARRRRRLVELRLLCLRRRASVAARA